MTMYHNFAESLAASHAAEDLPLWEEVYRKFFQEFAGMVNHRGDGDHQRAGIDRSVILNNGKTYWIDEKVRRAGKNGQPYSDIALEFIADDGRNQPGWVCKPLLAHYIAYANPPLGKAYLLPVEQLQAAWRKYELYWRARGPILTAPNRYQGREWNTISVAVPVNELFPAIGEQFRCDIENTAQEITIVKASDIQW